LLLLLLFGLALLLAAGALMIVRGISRPPRKTYAQALAQGDPTDPADLERTGQSITFDLPDGSTTPGWLVAGDNPTGPTVVILHGFGDSRYGALTRVPRLAPYASRLVAFDFRGQGEAEAAYSQGGAAEADDTIAVLEQLEDQRIVLFGYSMGAQIAIAAAARLGQRGETRLAGVIADGPYQHWQTPIVNTLRCKGLPAFPLVNLAGLLIACRAGRAVLFNRKDEALRLSVPLLILHGQADPICPLSEARALAEAAPMSTLVTFETGTHLDLDAQDPQRYDTAIANFFTNLPATSRPEQTSPATTNEDSDPAETADRQTPRQTGVGRDG
jgi:pimeloyl-ACP methyl ester carboxylesterase